MVPHIKLLVAWNTNCISIVHTHTHGWLIGAMLCVYHVAAGRLATGCLMGDDCVLWKHCLSIRQCQWVMG